MPYTIYNNNGTILVNIADGEVDNITTSLDLIGKNINNYGEYVNNNLVKLLTSFSNSAPPANPLTGQVWYDTNGGGKLRVFNGTEFRPVYQSQVSGTSPFPSSDGDFWYDTVNRQFKVFVNDAGTSEWRTIGPTNPYFHGKIGLEVPQTPVREEFTNATKNCAVIYSYGSIIGIHSSSTFTANTTTSVYYFNSQTATQVYAGTTILKNITARNNLYVEGDLYLKGEVYLSPNRRLTASYNRTWIGSAITDQYTATNNWIRLEILPYLFSTGTTATVINSEVKVLSSYNTQTEVRHFILQENVPGVRAWEAYEIYGSTGTQYWGVFHLGNTNTNVVKLGA